MNLKTDKENRKSKGDYIEGRFVAVTDPNGQIFSRNPGDLSIPLEPFSFCNAHVEEAVAAAKRGFKVWRRLSPQERFSALKRYREVVAAHQDQLAFLASFELGKPLWESHQELKDCLSVIDLFLQLGSQTSLETKVSEARPSQEGSVRYFPVGALAIVSQSVVPLVSLHHHFIPALLNGNSVILKMTKFAPALAQALALCAHEAQLPAGSFNLLQGDGDIARRLTGHSEVDGVFFTGTPETSIEIKKQLLNDYWKLQVIQSGGKNASVVWKDCDYDYALKALFLSAFSTSGQRYTNTSRVFLHEDIFDRFLKDFHALSKKCPIGYALVENSSEPFYGSLVSEHLVEDYFRYQGIAVREGCEEIMRGKALERSPQGYYVSPSLYVVHEPQPKSAFQDAEIFGPQVAFYKIKSIEECVSINNQSRFGLVASVYTQDKQNYLAFLEQAKVGSCHWNIPTTQVSYKMPFLGLKASGNLRPMGIFASYQCTYPQSGLSLTGPFSFPDALTRWG